MRTTDYCQIVGSRVWLPAVPRSQELDLTEGEGDRGLHAEDPAPQVERTEAVGFEKLELERNPAPLRSYCQNGRGAGRTEVETLGPSRGGGVGHQPGGGRPWPEALDLVLDEGAEAPADHHFGEDGVARLLQPEDDVPFDFGRLEKRCKKLIRGFQK